MSGIALASLKLRPQRVQPLSPPRLHPLALLRAGESAVRDGRRAPLLAFGKKRDVHPSPPVAPIETGRLRPGSSALAQLTPGQPTLTQRRVDERIVEPLNRDTHRPRPRHREA